MNSAIATMTPGHIFHDTYQVEKVIDEGAFGIVYRCRDLAHDRNVALKVLKTEIIEPRELRRFIAEGPKAQRVEHDNVVRVFAFGEQPPHVVMELLAGTNIKDVLENGHRFSIRRGLEIMHEVAAGLSAIHHAGLLHRDLKPQNIMILGNGTAKVIDLGLSKDTQTASSTVSLSGTLVGTLPYLSPEHYRGEPTGVPAEVFSYGIVFYEVLSGVYPFLHRDEYGLAFVNNILHRDPEPLLTLVPGLPQDLGELVMSCLEKSPERRPTLDQILHDLERISDHPLPSDAPRENGDSRPAVTWRNPYLNRHMIRDPGDFFGRASAITRIYSRLNGTPPGSVSIVGERRIGKSSLLNYIYSPANRSKHLESNRKTVMVLLDFKSNPDMTVMSFVRELLGMARVELRGQVDLSDCPPTLDGVKSMVQRLDEKGCRLALLFDDFDYVTKNPSFSPEFFSFLRYLANQHNVSYVTTSSLDLQVHSHKEILDSPFFNIFTVVSLSVFNHDEAEQLIRIPSQRVGKPLDRYADQIVDLAGRFPFSIQIACSHAIDYLFEHPEAARLDFGEVGRRFYRQEKFHYESIWERLDSQQKSTLRRVAGGQPIPESLKHVLDNLERQNYVEVDGERPRLFASAFEDFVKTLRPKSGLKTILEAIQWTFGLSSSKKGG